MTTIPPRPEGSGINIQPHQDGFLLTWKSAPEGFQRFGPAGFLIFWMMGWAVGETFAIKQLFFGDGPRAADFFLIAWLGGWTFGGIFCARQIHRLLRKPQPDRLILNRAELVFEPDLLVPIQPEIGTMGRRRGLQFKKRKAIQATRDKISNIAIERVGERQRLTFDLGADRIEIGENLREPEREWLAAVLNAWKTSP